jgi:hypothetical protein
MTVLADNEARRRILTEFGTSFFVEAAAGTGKTSSLTGSSGFSVAAAARSTGSLRSHSLRRPPAR